MKSKNYLTRLVCLIMVLSISCSSQTDQKSSDEQIISFTLDTIIKVNDLKGTNLIIYGPTITTSADIILVDRDSPYRVWWLQNNKLTDKGNTTTAITDFYNLPDDRDKNWLIGFSIISIDTLTNEAQVYVETSCGSTCGTMYTIQHNQLDQWEIKKEEELWISQRQFEFLFSASKY